VALGCLIFGLVTCSLQQQKKNCCDVRVVLLDDGSVWQPPKELQQLWTHLRLLMLESIWSVRCGSSGRPYSSTQVVSRFLFVLRQQIQQDWVRTSGDIRIDSGVPWLRGRSPVLSIRRFVSKWCVAGGGVYVVVYGDLHVTLQSLDDT
jgi:hypothetical protein